MKEFGTIFVIWYNARFSKLAKAARGIDLTSCTWFMDFHWWGQYCVQFKSVFHQWRALWSVCLFGIPLVFYWRRHILGRRCNQCTYNLRISASWDSFAGSTYSFICMVALFFSVTLCRGLRQYYDVGCYIAFLHCLFYYALHRWGMFALPPASDFFKVNYFWRTLGHVTGEDNSLKCVFFFMIGCRSH